MNRLDVSTDPALTRAGILTLDEVRFFVEYCHYRGVEANLAGSLFSFHAQQLWRLVPEVDQISTRGGSTAVTLDPSSDAAGSDTRHERVTKRALVRGLVPPEQGGCLNIPLAMKDRPGADRILPRLLAVAPNAEAFYVDRFGIQTPIPKIS